MVKGVVNDSSHEITKIYHDGREIERVCDIYGNVLYLSSKTVTGAASLSFKNRKESTRNVVWCEVPMDDVENATSVGFGQVGFSQSVDDSNTYYFGIYLPDAGTYRLEIYNEHKVLTLISDGDENVYFFIELDYQTERGLDIFLDKQDGSFNMKNVKYAVFDAMYYDDRYDILNEYAVRTNNALEAYTIYGNTINGESVGDYDENSGKYLIPVNVQATGQGSTAYNISLDEPLRKVDNDTEYIQKKKSSINGTLHRITQKTSGAAPLIFTSTRQTPKNYRIYGNTVDGESVGDRTENLFDGELQNGYWNNVTDLAQATSDVFKSFKVYLPAGTYTVSFKTNINIVRLIADGVLTQNIGNNMTSYTVTTQQDGDVGFSFRITGTQVPWDNSDIMFNAGSNALLYEPYGYRIPMTVNARDVSNELYHTPITTNLYLPEPLKMVGDKVEYADYQEQKLYFADGTSADVELPELPTVEGTNTLSIGTTVQPSQIIVEAIYPNDSYISLPDISTFENINTITVDTEIPPESISITGKIGPIS